MMKTANGTKSSNRRLGWFYSLMVLVAVLVFLAVRQYGESVHPGLNSDRGANSLPVATSYDADNFYHVLLAMAAVIVAGRLIGVVFRRIGQPMVIGEIVAGILLGPSFLKWIAPDIHAYLLPSDVAPGLSVIANFGVILYMFLVGLELNTGLLRGRGNAMTAISHASILFPFLLGTCLSLVAHSRYSSSDVSFTVFALFFGVSLSITAFPVLARILSERKLSHTPLGATALACAAVNDLTAWCLLALVVGVAQAKLESALLTVVLAVSYVGLMLVLIRPLMARLVRHYDGRETTAPGVTALVFVALLVSSLATELIGIHAIFGAFLLGAVIPHDSRIAREFIQKLEDIVAVLFLPAFFAITGMRTEISLVSGVDHILFCILIVLAATVGKFAGSALAGRIAGMQWRDASAIGVLMNTRGLMELIVLNVGLDLGVISPTLFAMLVVMALVTTMTTAPVLDLLVSRSGRVPTE